MLRKVCDKYQDRSSDGSSKQEMRYAGSAPIGRSAMGGLSSASSSGGPREGLRVIAADDGGWGVTVPSRVVVRKNVASRWVPTLCGRMQTKALGTCRLVRADLRAWMALRPVRDLCERPAFVRPNQVLSDSDVRIARGGARCNEARVVLRANIDANGQTYRTVLGQLVTPRLGWAHWDSSREQGRARCST
jgi:hypothetical protein